ncbi:MAG: signal peptidase I [Fusicatenibacter sp.]|nr:signal peptidase I [Fusicatenibacter sp.]
MSKQDEKKNKKSSEKSGIGREIWEYVRMTVVVVVVVILLEQFVIINARIPSPSMQNTIMTGDQIFGSRLAYLNSDPERYDIVIFYYPDDESQKFIKRVIGLPGETVRIVDGKVYINDSETPLDDSFCPETPLGDWGPYTVPEDHYFMLGDNRNVSKDSRYWVNTYVARDKIIGKAVLRYWPITDLSLIK